MCGIVAYVGGQDARGILVEGLKRLEYRGYDSSGIAILDGERPPYLARAVGKVAALEARVWGEEPRGAVGIAHTRWATHGKPSEANAHPHRDCAGKLFLAHNGIIENYLALKRRLVSEGHQFLSETDTEVLVHLVESRYQGNLESAVQRSLQEVQGTFGIAVIHSQQPAAVENALRGRISHSEGVAKLGGLESVMDRLAAARHLIIISCGTSYYAGLFGRYVFEALTDLTVETELASEFRYRKLNLRQNTVVLAISQSGETADTLAALREAKRKGALVLGLVNVVGSSIARETHAGVYSHAGMEIGAASTKSFISQLTILTLIALLVGRSRDR